MRLTFEEGRYLVYEVISAQHGVHLLCNDHTEAYYSQRNSGPPGKELLLKTVEETIERKLSGGIQSCFECRALPGYT